MEHDERSSRFDVQITERTNGLEIVAIDRNAGGEFGHVTLTTGPFTMEDDQRAVDGRQLEVVVGDRDVRHESEGYRVLQLPLFANPDSADFNELLSDPAVASALAPWGVTFEDPPELVVDLVARPMAEGDYHTCSYAPSSSCGSTSCIQTPYQWKKVGAQCITYVEQYVCCGNTMRIAKRRCGEGASNPCGAEGSGGCAVCWANDYTSSCSTYHVTGNTYYCTAGGDSIPFTGGDTWFSAM